MAGPIDNLPPHQHTIGGYHGGRGPTQPRRSAGSTGPSQPPTGFAPHQADPGPVHDLASTLASLNAGNPADGLERTEDGIQGSPKQGSLTMRMSVAGKKARGQAALSEGRVRAFEKDVLPLLTVAVAKRFGVNAKDLGRLFAGVNRDIATAGVKDDGSVDTNYPPRAASAVFNDPALHALFGLSPEGVEDAVAFTRRAAELEPPEGAWGPTVGQLSGDDAARLARVTAFLRDGAPAFDALSDGDQALALLMFVNNTTWHMTNFQRAAADPSRASVTERNGVFNTYPVNLRLQPSTDAAEEMVLMDAFQYGKKDPLRLS